MFERWIASDLPDEENARRARLLNTLVLACLLYLVLFALVEWIGWLAGWFETGNLLSLFAGVTAVAGMGVYAVNKSGRLRLAVWMFTVALCLIILILLLIFGHRSAVPMFITTVILSSSVLIRRQAAFTFAAGLGIVYLVIALAEVTGRWQPLLVPSQDRFPPDLLIVGRLLGMGVIAIIAWTSAGNLLDAIATSRRSLEQAQRREEELELARTSLEQQVREQTRDLEDALEEVRQRAGAQQSLVDALRRQSIPVVPLFSQIIAVPVVGVLDAQRAEQLLSSLLDGVQQYDARVALLDITGVPVVDEAAVQGLAQAVMGARMVGAECVLVGINPDIASKLVDLGFDTSGFISRVDMEAGLRYALQRMHVSIERESSA